jgi:hypothetical protein
MSDIERVKGKLRETILRFARRRLFKDFHAAELLTYCRVLHPEVAPDSPGRILRELRKDGVLDYVMTSRRNSEYVMLRVNNAA